MFIGDKETKTFRWVDKDAQAPKEQLDNLRSYLKDNYKIEVDGKFYSFIECPEYGLIQICQTAAKILSSFKESKTALDSQVTLPPQKPSLLARILSAVFPCFFKQDKTETLPKSINNFEMYKTEVTDELNKQYTNWWKHYEKLKKTYSVKTWEEARVQSLKLKEEIDAYDVENNQNLEERLNNLLANPIDTIKNYLTHENPPVHLLAFVLRKSYLGRHSFDSETLEHLQAIQELRQVLKSKNLD